jgi:para-aminobenzoate synthetase
MRTLLIDNYDSYTFNLYQLIAEVYGTTPRVLTNDASEWDTLDFTAFDAIVISPGPGSPHVPRDIGVCLDIVRTTSLPLLGVCLGHQAIACAGGGAVVRAPAPRHGYLERITHTGEDLFDGLPQGFTGVRYHSLAVDTPLPAELEATAWAEDGAVMALRHTQRPLHGVQFHPESIATEYGPQLLENFRGQCMKGARV